MNRFKHEISKIIQFANSGKISCYTDFYSIIEQIPVLDTRNRKRKIVGAIERFDLLGHYPDGTNSRALHLMNNPQYQLCDEYKSVIDHFIETETQTGRKKDLTIHREATSAANFLLRLQQLGIFCLADITQDAVLKVFAMPDGQMRYRYSCKHRTEMVLKTCIPIYPVCERIIAFLPAFKKSRKNIQYLTQDEISKVKGVLLSDSDTLSLRDKAIGIIALYLGLRGCDIANLTFNSIDWEKETIFIRQQKTNMPLTLPLPVTVGNAIYDYVKEERPQVDCEYIFVTQIRPLGRDALKVVPT